LKKVDELKNVDELLISISLPPLAENCNMNIDRLQIESLSYEKD